MSEEDKDKQIKLETIDEIFYLVYRVAERHLDNNQTKIADGVIEALEEINVFYKGVKFN